MAISAQSVKELREITGSGMMECKKALEATGGDLQQAIDALRRQGLKAQANKQARVASDGIVVMAGDDWLAVMVEMNCETDFAAKNEDFVAVSQAISKIILEKNPARFEQVADLPFDQRMKIGERISALVAKIGEKISCRRFVRFEAGAGEKIGSYVHLGSKIGVLVVLKGGKVEPIVLKDVAMHVAASHPRYLKRGNIPADVIEKEKAIYREQLKDSGKPAAILEKIAEGKVAKFVSEVCLNDQIFIKDPAGKQTVAQMLKSVDSGAEITNFARFQVGEGLEKKKDDFAVEVARIASK